MIKLTTNNLVDTEIQDHMIRIACNQGRSSLPAASALIVFTTLICLDAESQNTESQIALCIWTAVMLFATLGRYVVIPMIIAEGAKGKFAYGWHAGTCVSGLGWGIMGGFLMPKVLDIHQLIVMLIIAGILAAAISIQAPTISLYGIFLGLVLFPFLIRLAILGVHQWFYILMIPPFIIYSFVLYQTGASIYATLVTSFKAELTNRRLVLQLEGAMQEAKTASLAKDRFLANINHELRTPLNSIIGFSELLKINYSGTINETQRKYVDNILSNGRKLDKLIDNLLEFTKIDTESFKSQVAVINISSLLKQVVDRKAKRARENDVTLSLGDYPQTQLISAPVWVDKILDHLIENGIKFSRGGKVVLSADRLEEGPVRIHVQDDGIGMTPEQKQHLFQLFTQGDDGYNRQFDGLGLGLMMSWRMVQQLGGTITAESDGHGKGCRFTVTLPDMVQPSYVKDSIKNDRANK